jgi:hypothetical protein
MEATMQSWKLWTLRLAFSIAMILFGYTVGTYKSASTVHAQAVTQINLPKAWGPLVGTMTGVLVLQDRAGTIRLVSADTGVVAEYITRQ